MNIINFKKVCSTCEYNHFGECNEGRYDEQVKSNDTCESWSCSGRYIDYLQMLAPWYIKNKFNKSYDYKEFVMNMEKHSNGEPIKVEFYDAVMKTYNLSLKELAEVLNVKPGVITYAMVHNTPKKRLYEFSRILCIPYQLFDNITSLDLPKIEKCKNKFYKIHTIKKIDEIKKSIYDREIAAEKRFLQKNYPKFKRNFDKKLEEYSKLTDIHHDMSDDYRKRAYVVAIKFQKDDYYGFIYDDYEYGGYGLCDTDFIETLSIEKIDQLNEKCLLINDIGLTPKNNKVVFTLHDDSGNETTLTTNSNELKNYIVEYKMVKCEGVGNKKERRKCLECKNFIANSENAKGYCTAKETEVPRSRIICGFDFVSK